MTSLVDLERCRTDYFDNAVGDVVEPSSSPSEGSPSPLRPLTADQVASFSGTPASTPSHEASRDPVFNEDYDFRHFRKGHRSHVRESSTSSSKKLSSLLILTSERLDKETRRANDAERRAMEAITLARSANEAKLIAQRDATRANEELRLYKVQYDNAQREIFKAQELIDQIEAERQEAEASAARARSTARKLKEQNLIIMAREEGRVVGYQEGLATGRRMAYEERTRAGEYTDESDSDGEIILPEQPSNIRLRSPTPGTGSRPSSRPPAARQPPPAPPPPNRPPSRTAYANIELMLHPSTLATPIKPPQQTQAGAIRLEVTPPPKNLVHSKSDQLVFPPDGWNPVADRQSHIAMPPSRHMSPSPSSITLGPPVRVPASAPVPPPPVIAEDATVETSTTSETSSEPGSTQQTVRDHIYSASKLRERQFQRSRTPAPLSPGSTRISDFGIVSSPQTDRGGRNLPAEAQSFEIERSSTPMREKMRESWSLKKVARSASPIRGSGSPAPVHPVTGGMIVAPQPRKPGKSPLSRVSSSSSSTTAARPSSSISSPEMTKLDPRKGSSSGGDSRTPLSWLFNKKRMKEQSSEKGTPSGESVDIEVESPSESGRSIDEANVVPGRPPQPLLLSPDYRVVAIPGEPSTSTPKTIGGNQNLPPLSEFTGLISPGREADLPPGFVPNPPLTDQVRQGDHDGGGGQPPRRSASTRSKRRGVDYETAPLTPGVNYLIPSPGGDIPRSKSRASRSSRQGQVYDS